MVLGVTLRAFWASHEPQGQRTVRDAPDMFARRVGNRWEWMIPLSGGMLTGWFTYASKSSALRAGRRAFAKLQRSLAQGDMP